MSIATMMVTASRPSTCPFILLVDDDEHCLRLLCEVVQSAGHSCIAATSAQEALAYCNARRPQVVLTDLSMPGLDGCDLGLWMKARHPDVPVVLVTGEQLDAPARSRLAPTFVAILSKPVEPDRLLCLLSGLVAPPPHDGGRVP